MSLHPNRPKNPVLSFLWSKFALVVALVAGFFLFKWERAFIEAGPLVYAPVLFLEAIFMAFAARNLALRHSVDEFAWRGMFTAGWKSLSAAEQVRWTMGVTLALIYCASLIVSALAK